MFRTTATRSLARTVRSLQPSGVRNPTTNNALRASLKTSAKPFKASNTLALALRQPVQQKALVRYDSGVAKIDHKAEEEYQKLKLEPTPEIVSTSSSIHPVTGEVATEDPHADIDMMAGIRGDFVSGD